MDILAETHMGYITKVGNNDILAQAHIGYLTGLLAKVADIYDGVSALLTLVFPTATVDC